MDDLRRNADLDGALADARARFTAANPASAARHAAARASLPGGNTRSVLHYAPFPVAIARGHGVRLTDIDGHVYTDFVCEYTAGLYGHSSPVLMQAMTDAIADGVALGGPNRYEAPLAAALCARFPALDRVRFTNSGTEANVMAISTARAVTGRAAVMAFHEGYHGGVLSFGHGGSPLNLPFPMVMATYNDVDGTEALIRSQDLACVILEPMLGGGGCIRATDAFLAMLRRATQDTGAILILDEVMTSRLSPGGLQAVAGITPDLMTLGKYLGGGAGFGAFGGRADIMDRFDPAAPGAFGHAGTFNNNVLSMAAGLAGVTQVLTPGAVTAMNALGEAVQARLRDRLAAHGVAGAVTGCGSLFNLHFHTGPTPASIKTADPRPLRLWHMQMMLAGQYVTPRGMMALALPHTAAETESLVAAFDRFLADHAGLLPAAAP